MTALDRFLQSWRIRKASRHLPCGARVLDVGSAEGALFQARDDLAGGCIGIDPTLARQRDIGPHRLLKGFFPQDLPMTLGQFDVITMLAVLEHFPAGLHAEVAHGCWRFLKPGGRLIITVPSPIVDKMLVVLKAVRLVEGMSLEEHHGYEVCQTAAIFREPRFRLLAKEHFQFGLNHLFVFERAAQE